MNPILDIPSVRARVSRITVEAYHRQPEYNHHRRRTELIRGIVIEKMSKSPLHTTISSRLYRKILTQIPPEYNAWKEEPLTFADSEPEPDVSVVKGGDADRQDAHPSTAALAVEVAVTSPREDRELALLYAEAGVAEYWVVIPMQRIIEVYRHSDGTRYLEVHVYRAGETLECGSVPGVRVALDELFAGL